MLHRLHLVLAAAVGSSRWQQTAMSTFHIEISLVWQIHTECGTILHLR